MIIKDKTNEEQIVIEVDSKRIGIKLSRDIKELCEKRIKENPRDIHFDFSSVEYINSSCIGNLIYLSRQLNKKEKALYIDKLTPSLRSLLKDLQMHEYFNIEGLRS